MGTQATHVDKLARVWPGYVQVWRELCGVDLEGKTIWMHEGGWTPFPFLLGWLLTGRGAIVTNEEGRVSDQYARRALDAALLVELPGVPEERREHLKTLADDPRSGSAAWLIELMGGSLHEGVKPEALPLADASADLRHTGGTLEHYPPAKLRASIGESIRVLAPGGIASHVFDHRDHLYHADKRYPFLNHLRFRDATYAAFFGHRLLYHNRLLPAEIRRIFQEAGFEEIAVRRLVLPEGRYLGAGEDFTKHLLGIDRGKLATRFQGAEEADLYTAAGHYLFRKPG